MGCKEEELTIYDDFTYIFYHSLYHFLGHLVSYVFTGVDGFDGGFDFFHGVWATAFTGFFFVFPFWPIWRQVASAVFDLYIAWVTLFYLSFFSFNLWLGLG